MTARILGRKKAHRTWLMRNLATSIILYERVVTTAAKAKEIRGVVDRVINLGKIDNLANRRRLLAFIADKAAARKIWEVLKERYADRTSGYTRLTKLGQRVGDGAEQILIELIATPEIKKTDASETTPTTDKVEAKEIKKGLHLPRIGKPKAKVTVRRKGASK